MTSKKNIINFIVLSYTNNSQRRRRERVDWRKKCSLSHALRKPNRPKKKKRTGLSQRRRPLKRGRAAARFDDDAPL